VAEVRFSLKAVLEALGPNSALIFAAWIFMAFLQERYLAALERYRLLIEDYRHAEVTEDRHRNIRDQVMLYKQRCELMKLATNLGLFAAIFLIAALVLAAFHAIFHAFPMIVYVSAACAVAGLALITVGATVAIKENSIIQRAIDSELLDVPDLAQKTGQKPGSIAD
jgi:hypothetical protein